MVAAFLELGVADEAEHARGAASRAKTERQADGDAEAVPERTARDLNTWDTIPVGVMTQWRVVAAEGSERVDIDEALGREHGVVRHRSVSL